MSECISQGSRESPFDAIASDQRAIQQGVYGHCRAITNRVGNHYVLMVCDYATHYPEAIPLKSIDAEHVDEKLVELFARVGILKEILTDQGSNTLS